MWLVKEVITRPDFSTGMKALWIVLAFPFSIGALIVYVLVVRKKDHSESQGSANGRTRRPARFSPA